MFTPWEDSMMNIFFNWVDNLRLIGWVGALDKLARKNAKKRIQIRFFTNHVYIYTSICIYIYI